MDCALCAGLFERFEVAEREGLKELLPRLREALGEHGRGEFHGWVWGEDGLLVVVQGDDDVKGE